MPLQRKKILVAVMDSSKARFLKLENGDLVAAQPMLSSEESHKPARDLKSDRPGRSLGSSRSGVRHAIEPHHDYHKLEKHKFAARVAAVLDKAMVTGGYDELVLVAPRRSIGELRTLLSEKTLACIRQEVAKDLVKQDTAGLRRQLAPVLAIRS